MFANLAAFLSIVSLALAAPVTDLAPRSVSVDTASHCGLWDTVTAGAYSLLLDQWGTSGATGSQCAHLTSLSGSSAGATVAWSTTWKWNSASGGIKSYTNMQLNKGLNKQLKNIKSIPSVWQWSNKATGTIVADVAYDIFTSSTSGGKNENEIMVWLSNINAGPISASYNAQGKPVAIASNVSLAGHTWNVYKGSNGYNVVYSFLPVSGSVTSFNGDVNLFLKYLTSKQGLSSSQYLTTYQAGTEATSGAATFTTSAYSAVIN